MKALILAGGLGTRLRGILRDLPKPLAPIAGKPFLEYLVCQLRKYGFRDVVLSTGHLSEKIVEAFGEGQRLGVAVSYSEEKSPAGTGGAIRLAAPQLDGEAFIVANGDSFLDLDLTELVSIHRDRSALITMALAKVNDTSRYGGVTQDDAFRVISFEEKGQNTGPGLINAGVYVLSREIFDHIPKEPHKVSLERDVFPELLGDRFFGHVVDGFFWDIGIPEDYETLCAHPEPLIMGTR